MGRRASLTVQTFAVLALATTICATQSHAPRQQQLQQQKRQRTPPLTKRSGRMAVALQTINLTRQTLSSASQKVQAAQRVFVSRVSATAASAAQLKPQMPQLASLPTHLRHHNSKHHVTMEHRQRFELQETLHWMVWIGQRF